MAQHRDLNARPGKKLADAIRAARDEGKSSKTGAHGVKDLGETGDAVWTDGTGATTSVRQLPERIEEARTEIDQARGDIADAEQAIADETAAREAAFAEAQNSLADLDERLNAKPDAAELEAIRSDLAETTAAVAEATADASDAAAAAAVANENALAAAGIAATKGRVIYAPEKPTAAEDQNASNLWIDSDDGRVYVWDDSVGDWIESESESLRDAAQAAAAAQQAAEAADQKAQDAASAAAAAQQAAAEAQATADEATLDAAEAHNAAVAAGEAAEQAAIDAAGKARVVYQDTPPVPSGDVLWFDTANGNVPKTWTGGLGEGPRRNRAINPLGPGAENVTGWHGTRFDSEVVEDEGRSAVLLTSNSDASGPYFDPLVRPYVPLGTVINFSMEIKVPALIENGLRVYLPGYNGATLENGSTGPYYSQAPEDGWVRAGVSATVTAMPEDGYVRTLFWPAKAAFPLGTQVMIRDVLIEYDTSGVYFDGDSTGASWAGDRYASESVFDGPGWAVLQDEAVLAAQAAAEAAAAAAEAARELAESKPGMDEVEAAITVSANGKNAITVAATAPPAGTPGVVVGDTWWQVDGSGNIFGQWTWTGTAWSPRLVASEVIASLDVGKLTVIGESRFSTAVIDVLFADLFTAHKITAEQITITAIDENGDLAPGSVRGVTIGDGEVTANKITIVGDPDDPDEAGLVANIAAIMKLAVENLVVTEGATINDAVVLKLASEMVTAGVIRTAESGQRVVIDETGLVMYGVDSDGVDFELVRIGPSGDNVITVGESTLGPDGVAAPNGDFEALTIGGDTVGDLLANYPRGVVGIALSSTKSAWNGTNEDIRRLEVYATLEPDRRYRVTVDQHYVQLKTANAMTYVETIRRGLPGSVTIIGIARHQLAASTVEQTVGSLVAYVDTRDATGPVDEVFGFAMRGPAGRDVRILGTTAAALRLTVEDVGPSLYTNGSSYMDTGSAVETIEQDAPPPVVTIKRYTKTFSATGYRTYDADGSASSPTPPDVVQGLYGGGPSRLNRRGGWTFGSMTGTLSGATIEKVRVKIYCNHTYSSAGSTVNVCTWGGTMATSLTTRKTVTGWKKNTAKWVTLPSSTFAGFKSGAIDGIGVKPTSTSSSQYARFATSAKIEVTYTKAV